MVHHYRKMSLAVIALLLLTVIICSSDMAINKSDTDINKEVKVMRSHIDKQVVTKQPEEKNYINSAPEADQITFQLSAATPEAEIAAVIKDASASATKSAKIPENTDLKYVTILYYHCVSDNVFGIEELFVSPAEFEKQMNFLKINSYNVITFEQLNEIKDIKNPVIITFDDGYENNYLEAYPILKKYNFKASIFLSTGFINGQNMLKEDQVKDMLDLINFQDHSITHPDLTKLDDSQLDHELSDSKIILENLTGQKVSVLAYPNGSYNSKVIKTASKYFKYAVSNVGGFYTENSNNYEIKRVYIPRNLDINGFEKKIKGR